MKEEEITKLAALARIATTPDERARLAHDLESILGYISEIQTVEGTAPERVAGELRNVMREDANPHERGACTQDMIAAAPRTESKYIKVQQVL